MYVPPHFADHDRARVLAFIAANSFGTLVSMHDGAPFATHAPFCILADGQEPVLGVHIARANPQWRDIAQAPVLAVFRGAHAHVSASWYERPGETVPTWDYAAVHCSGEARIAGAAATRRILQALVDANEGERGWHMTDVDPAYLDGMQRAIVGIEIAVARIDAQFKYSQNRTDRDRERVIEHLRAAADPLANALAAEMTAYAREREAER